MGSWLLSPAPQPGNNQLEGLDWLWAEDTTLTRRVKCGKGPVTDLDDEVVEVMEESKGETDEAEVGNFEHCKRSVEAGTSAAGAIEEDLFEDRGREKHLRVHQDKATSSAAHSSSHAAHPSTKAGKLLPAVRQTRNKPIATL